MFHCKNIISMIFLINATLKLSDFSLSLSHSYGPWTREYFEDVDQTWETFEKTLWGHISNFYKLSKERYIFFVLIWKNLRFVIALIPYEIHFISCTQL